MYHQGILVQAYAVLWINMVNFNYGITVGWSSPSLPLLKSEDSPLPSGPLTLLEVSWIGAMLCIGGALATVFYGWFCEKYGRKVAMLWSAINFLVRPRLR